ncbi:hypothetical protein [uncultured Duncaniella sp.]|uniref:hypothetical protein n=1 Tax=uncultured Duncaniella sp. TaxID=2768039 RepID=UPI0025DD0F9D|nr:hypothetical protein [uncultured Duncaniella sp.]
MHISLSTTVITDTVHALAALESLSAADDTARTLLRPLLDRERTGILRLMVKNAFAEIILHLLPYVDGAELDNELPAVNPGHQAAGDEADTLLGIDLRLPAGVSATLGPLLRRNLELAVTYRVLAVAVTSASSVSDAASTLASSFSDRSANAVAAMLAALRSPGRPFVRSRAH